MNRPSLKKYFSIFIILIVLSYFGWRITNDWQTVTSLNWNINPFDFLIFMLVLPLPFLIDVLAWHFLTLAVGERIKFLQNFEIWMLSNFARYLPGGVWQYPGRVILLSKIGVSKTSSVTCLVLEALFVIFVGLSITLAVVLSGGLAFSFESIKFLVLISLILFVMFFIVTSEKIMTNVSKFFVKIVGKGGEIKSVKLPYKWVPVLLFSFLLEFLFPVLILFLLARSLTPLGFDMFPSLLGAYAISWLLGYVAFFAPAGIGVREASLAGFLSFYMPFSVAAIVVIAARVALFISEAIGFGLAIFYSRHSKS